jgi:hypothetical protein
MSTLLVADTETELIGRLAQILRDTVMHDEESFYRYAIYVYQSGGYERGTTPDGKLTLRLD